MDAGAALRAVSNGAAYQQLIGIKMLSKVKDIQTSQVATLLADFSVAQQQTRAMVASSGSSIGRHLDIKV
jgi:hypothetical protein